uniref:Uncharacterized protein n=1 Tax=Trypanosoma congolense (strain IL3000) TaxID=1068625 RepID=G0ULJ0_TRYCI|nr:hypothetical protein, unlikely [Trypanosoma congolense IL3000]
MLSLPLSFSFFFSVFPCERWRTVAHVPRLLPREELFLTFCCFRFISFQCPSLAFIRAVDGAPPSSFVFFFSLFSLTPPPTRVKPPHLPVCISSRGTCALIVHVAPVFDVCSRLSNLTADVVFFCFQWHLNIRFVFF